MVACSDSNHTASLTKCRLSRCSITILVRQHDPLGQGSVNLSIKVINMFRDEDRSLLQDIAISIRFACEGRNKIWKCDAINLENIPSSAGTGSN